MEKTMTLNLRVNPTVKQQAEDVLKQLGIPMATAIDMYRFNRLTNVCPYGKAADYNYKLGSGSNSNLKLPNFLRKIIKSKFVVRHISDIAVICLTALVICH